MRVNAGQAFNFFPVPTDIHFGFGMVDSLPELIRSLKGRKALLITDPGLRVAGIPDRIMEILGRASVGFALFDRVKPDSGSGLIDSAAAELTRSGCDVVVGIGGGSSLDTAKAVAALATNSGSCLDYVGLNKISKPSLPVIASPTTAGTGSEVTLWSVFTDDGQGMKVAIGSLFLHPAIALCDPGLSLGLPPLLTASTGMDALAHAVECYTNNACQPISASLALQAIELVGCHLRSAVLNGRDHQSRYAMLLASTMAGIAMNPTRLGLAHALAMPLGSWDVRIPHGIALAVTLPAVMEFNHLAEPERYVAVARAMGERVDHLSAIEAAGRSIRAVRNLARDIGIPAHLSEFGLSERHIDAIVGEAMKSGNVAVNPRRASAKDLEGILRSVL
jgi:alcohol dehydrogenase